MLWEEMAKYTELTGEDATHVPIMKIGAYLDGYEKGKEVLAKIRAEIEQLNNLDYVEPVTVDDVLQIINKFIAEEDKA